MSSDDTVTAYILDTQIKVFDDARLELQLTAAKIAERAKVSIGTVNAWAQGRNMLSLWGLKKLLRIRELAPLLSRLFDPEEFALVAVISGINHDAVEQACRDYLRDKGDAHRIDSPAGREISSCEDETLSEGAARLRSVTI